MHSMQLDLDGTRHDDASKADGLRITMMLNGTGACGRPGSRLSSSCDCAVRSSADPLRLADDAPNMPK